MDKKAQTHPGVYIQPPIFYLAVFFAAHYLHKIYPLDSAFFSSPVADILSFLFFIIALYFGIPAVWLFFKARTTVETFRPAKALQTTGIYTKSRNPMYVGLSLFYFGFCLQMDSWWYFILFPIIFAIMNFYVIRREELYLEQRFGKEYLDFKSKVRRWL